MTDYDKVKALEHRVMSIEQHVQRIDETLHTQNITDVKLQQELQSLREQVLGIKKDVIDTLNEHSKQTWALVNKGMKVICLMVGFICLMAGVKLLPDILQILGGI